MTLIFITGGVRSGKSAFAENYAQKISQEIDGKRIVYIATGVATDSEMLVRILRHQVDRRASSYSWHTIEEPYRVDYAMQQLTTGDVALWDCVTTWLTNCFYEGYDTGTPCVEKQGCVERKIVTMKKALLAAKRASIPLIIVSNELLDEPPYAFHEVELYRQYLGELHQWFVSEAEEVYELDYGIAKRWK